MQRALTVDFPEDAAARRIADAYMFGPSLLVTPIVSAGDSGKATTREIYFPQGSWINFHSGEKYGGTQNVSFTLQQAPFFCRKGSLLVLGPSIQSTADTNPDLEVRIYPGADATFALFEDDGSSTKYREGSYSTIDFAWQDSISAAQQYPIPTAASFIVGLHNFDEICKKLFLRPLSLSLSDTLGVPASKVSEL